MAGSSRIFGVLLSLVIGVGALEASLTPASADPYNREEDGGWRLSLFDPSEADRTADETPAPAISVEDFFAPNRDPRPIPREHTGRWERWSADDFAVPPGSLVDDFLRSCHELRLNCFTPLEPATRLSRKLYRTCQEVAETQAFVGLAPKVSEGVVGNAVIGHSLGCAVLHSGPLGTESGRTHPREDLYRAMLDRGWVAERTPEWSTPATVLRRDGAICSLPPRSEVISNLVPSGL